MTSGKTVADLGVANRLMEVLAGCDVLGRGKTGKGKTLLGTICRSATTLFIEWAVRAILTARMFLVHPHLNERSK